MSDDHKANPPKGSADIVQREAIPIVEERVDIGSRTAEGKTVSVTLRPVSETIEIDEPVLREAVSVERVPIGQVIDEAPPIREEGDLTVVPVVEERITVLRELVLTEEILLRRTRETRRHRETATLRRTEAEIATADD